MSSPSPSPTKRKAPVKREASTKLLGMTDTELKALCFGSICTSEKIKVDYDKLATMLNITRKSASNQYTAARNKLDKAIQDTGIDPTDMAEDHAAPAKKPKVAKPKAPRAPKKPRKTNNASEAKSEAEVKAEAETETEAGMENGAKSLKKEESDLPDPLNLLYDENDNYLA